MKIRRAVAADAALWQAERLKALRLAPAAFGARLADWQDRPVSDFAAEIESYRIFFAFDADRPVGHIRWCPDADPAETGRAWVEAVFVDPAARGQGCAQALIAAALADALTAGMAEVWLDVGAANSAAQSAYRKAGFRAVPADQRPRSAASACELSMVRILP
ncbi:MAG: GNAT family N-acetyltransferase [Paracoccaceae bacterium]